MNEKAIKKLRRKFMLTALISFVSVMMLISAMIFVGNVITTTRQVVKTLNYLSDQDGEIDPAFENKVDAKNFQENQNSEKNFFTNLMEDMFNTGIDSVEFIHSVRYFSVKFDSSGNPVSADTNHIAMVDRDDAERIAGEAIKNGGEYGNVEGFYYKATDKGDTSLVVCVDISVQMANIRRIGSIALVILVLGTILGYFIVRLISWHMIKPEIRAVEQQKQFITNASHELKTPLAVIRANTELEMMMHEEDEWNKSTMNQVDRMTELINELVLAAKADELVDKEKLEEIDVSKIASDAAESFTSVATQDGKKLEKEIPENIKMRANSEQIRQLVSILTDNAIKYCDENGTVAISLAQRGRGIKLCVSNDYAKGENVDYNKFFDRFYREDKSHNIDKGGYGIGLSIANGIVKSYRGSIDVSWKDGVITFECRLK